MVNCNKCNRDITERDQYSLYTERSERAKVLYCHSCMVKELKENKATGCNCCRAFTTKPVPKDRVTELLYDVDPSYGIDVNGDVWVCPRCTNKRARDIEKYNYVSCSHCQRIHAKDEGGDVEGIGHCCAHCYSNLKKCERCGKVHVSQRWSGVRRCQVNDDGSVDSLTVYYCGDCMQHTKQCELCSKTYLTDELEDGICARCVASNPFSCEICGKRRSGMYRTNLDRVTTHHEDVCSNCYDRHGGSCRECGELHLPLGAKGHHRHCTPRNYCPKCANGAVVPDWRYRGRIQKHGTGELFFGVENENEFKTQHGVDKFRKFYQDKQDRCWLVHDGTLNMGVEVAFQPMTFDYWMGRKGDRLVMDTRRLVDKSYDLQGVHVHMSKDAFTTRHLYRFINFLTVYKPLLAHVAGRDVGLKRDFWQGEKVIDIAKEKSSPDKYKFINAKPEHTVEIRLFKGAFHISTVRMYIQFLDAVFHFTQTVSAKDTRLEDFYQFVNERHKYKLIALHLSSTKPSQFTAVSHSSVGEAVDEDELSNEDAGVLPSNIGKKRQTAFYQNIGASVTARYTGVVDEVRLDDIGTTWATSTTTPQGEL